MSIDKTIAVLLGVVCVTAYGNSIWFSDKEYDTSTESGGNAALVDLSYWVDPNGSKGNGEPGKTDDLVFDGSKGSDGKLTRRLRFGGGTFNFNSLQIGTANNGCAVVFGGNEFACANEGLKLRHGNWWINGSNDKYIRSDINVLSDDASRPFVMHVAPETRKGCRCHITGRLKGADDAQLMFGPWPQVLAAGDLAIVCAPMASFYLYDISQYKGTVTVASRFENDFANNTYGTRLVLTNESKTVESDAKLHISRGGSLAMGSFGYNATVGELSLASGSRLDFTQSDKVADGKLWCVRARDALSVEKGESKVEILWKPMVLGVDQYRIPILIGPLDSTFAADDFCIKFASHQYNMDLHLEVDSNAETGTRTLYAVVGGCVYQESCYDKEDDREGMDGYPSSLTNDVAWWNGLAPHAANATAVYYTDKSLRTLYAPAERYEFPCSGFVLDGGALVIQTQTFEVPEFWCNGGAVGVGARTHNDTYSYPVVSLIAPKIHLSGDEALTLHAHIHKTLVLKGEMDGTGNIAMKGWQPTGTPAAHYILDGFNTNFTGNISVESVEVRPAYHNFDVNFPTLHVLDGRNLGGRKTEFDPCALTLTTLARLSVTNNSTVVLAEGLNRGIYIKSTGRFHVSDSGVLDVRWPILLSGKMWKEGDGTLILGGGMKHETDGGDLTDLPRANSNLFDIVGGTVKIASAEALSGVVTSIGEGAALKLAMDPENADLVKYGICNTSVSNPFILHDSFEGKLPLSLDTAKLSPPVRGNMLTNALVTVRSSIAAHIREMLPVLHPLRDDGLVSVLEMRDNNDGTTTFYLVSGYKGLCISIR